MLKVILNSLPASCNFYHLLIIFANSIDTAQGQKYIRPDLNPNFLTIDKPPDKSAYLKVIFLFPQPKHMLWVFKRTVSVGGFF